VRIPRPVRRKPGFKRRSSPPPAARKLLLASLLSGLLLLGMLAIVFIPRAFQNEGLPVIPRIEVFVVVAAVSAVRPLSDFNATYSRSGATLVRIDRLADGATNGSVSFHDVDGDGHLTTGDEFRLPYNGAEVLRVWYLPGRAIVGYWPPPP